VQAGQNDDFVILEDVEQSIREAGEADPPDVPSDLAIELRVLRDQRQDPEVRAVERTS
jgi:hypothetical protein